MTFNRPIAALLVTAAIFIASPAFAHSEKSSTVPEDGATVASVEKIEIGFTMEMRVTSVKLLSGETELPLARTTGMESVKKFTARPEGPLATGAYAVEWRGMSPDGHVMEGEFEFTVSE